MHRVRMLVHYGVKPYIVFDGDYLPSKAMTEDSRAASREQKKKAAMELLKAGKPAQATQEFQKCIDVTPEMASTVIRQLKKMDIPYVVAPYEADAQLVYLEKQGIIDGILSDDSDLLVFGAKRLLTKLDKYGACIEINRRDFCACREVSLTGWSDAEFRRMAILSGCDYLEGLPSVGLKTAYRMLRKSKTPEKVVKMLQFQGKRISENYMTLFYQAELTFLHQWVFCPEKQELVHLTDLDGTRVAEEMPYIGSHVEPELARGIAKGDINPITKASIVLASTSPKRRHSQMGVGNAAPAQPAGKPIDKYFKGDGRIPMGAMDPNCFSVDPQRLAQLTDGGAVPRVFPLPRPYLNEARRSSAPKTNDSRRTSPRVQRRRTEPIGNLLASMDANSSKPTPKASSTASVTSGSTVDQPTRPPKKARLCDDAKDDDESPKQSKFFNALKVPKARRAKSEAYLLSDDSVEDALKDLPDFEGWNPKTIQRKPIAIFDESIEDTSQDATEAMSQETATTEFMNSQLSKEDSFASPNAALMPPPKLTRSISETPVNAGLSQFAYSSSATTATPSSVASSRRTSVFSAASTPMTAPSTAGTASSSSRPTALQRLANQALNSPKPRAKPAAPRRSSGLENLPVNPSFVPLPRVNLKEVEALNLPCGSEDQIIPASDDEDDFEDDEFVDDQPAKKLNLARFAYV